jgi:hypothetical protein
MGISVWQLIITLFIILPLALLPTIIALKINHPHKIAIILVNIIGGIFWGIGWLIALVWCFITPDTGKKKPDALSEIEKLHDLLEKGALTQEEYDSKKKELLKL